MFQRNRPRRAPSAWWLVPIGIGMIVVGILVIAGTGGDTSSRLAFLPVIGVVSIVLGIVLGLRGDRLT